MIKNTLLNPEARYLDFDGIVKMYNNIDINNYVILKLQPRYSDILKWFKSTSSKDKNIDDNTVAYKGNLNINFIEELDIVL